MSKPSAYHEAQRAIWRAKLRMSEAEEFRRHAFCLLASAQEVELMELREMRDDPASTAEAINVIQRIRKGERP